MDESSAPLLAEIAQQLSSAEIPWGIFAGAAIYAYGVVRPVTDVDILISSDSGGRAAICLPQAKPELDEAGQVAMLALPGFEIIAGLTRTIKMEMDGAMRARLVPQQLWGVEVRLLSVEDNLVFKVIMGRGPEVGKRDWADAAELLACGETLDWDYLHGRLRNCALGRADDLFVRLQQMAGE
ncbi:MAG TPA: hypothetical protein DEH25_10610 [Chloroflexi bacterium]|nr:hypothetical protein [Chloroflexota bacterium]